MMGFLQTQHLGANFLRKSNVSLEQCKRRHKRHSLVEIFNAMDLIGGVHGERYAVQAFAAYYAAETLGMVRFASRSQYSVQDRVSAHAAFFQCVLG